VSDHRTTEQIESVASKLNEFADGLTPPERETLAWIIAHAEADDEVSGYLGTLSSGPQGTQGPAPRVTVRRPQGPDQQGIIAILIGL
jgi:hypothetical protein